MSNFTLLASKFDKAEVAAQGSEWEKELDDEVHARATLSLNAAEQLTQAKEFYEAHVNFVASAHAARTKLLADIKSAVSENEQLAADTLVAEQELHDYLNSSERLDFAQKVLEIKAMDKEIYDYLLAKGRLGRPPLVEDVTSSADMGTNPLMEPLAELM